MPPADHFDGEIAERYDVAHATMFDRSVVEPVVDRLYKLAGNGAALEFGIGTGRIALPLAKRGVTIHGIDLSGSMLAALHRKPGADLVQTYAGDFVTTTVDASFSLVYLVFNTIMNLTHQAEQVQAFCNAAAHLQPGGRFVVEVMVPELRRLPPGETTRVFAADTKHWGFDEYDTVSQRLISHHLEDSADGMRRRSLPLRYVWPAELDLMAQIAGMEFEQRWGGWRDEPFTAHSRSHVSVWRV